MDEESAPEVLAATEGAEGDAAPAAATGVKVVSVTANGTGCPAGTFKPVVSEDGKSFSLRFESFGGRIDSSKKILVEDCQIAIKTSTDSDYSLALTGIKLGGWVSLGRGSSARLLTKSYFQGNPTESVDTQDDFSGPRLSRLRVTKPESDKLVWSPCGKERDLNVRTTVRLNGQGESPRGTVRIDEIEGLDFVWKKCGENPDEGGENPDEGGEQPDPNAPGITSISALGSGCPADTSHVALKPDGMSAVVTYSAFEAQVNANQSVAVKDCQLAIAFKNMDRYKYQVTSSVGGYAYLEAGMNARILQRAYVQGNPTVADEQAITLTGPIDDIFTHNAAFQPITTACGPARDLNVRSTVRLQNAAERADGYVTVATNDSSLGHHNKQTITVTATPCE